MLVTRLIQELGCLLRRTVYLPLWVVAFVMLLSSSFVLAQPSDDDLRREQAIRNLRSLGVSGEIAEHFASRTNYNAVSTHPQLMAAIARLRSLGLSNEQAVAHTNSVFAVDSYMHPQFMAAIARLRGLGLPNEQAVAYTDSVDVVDSYMHPQFMAAIARLRDLGFSNEQALGRTKDRYRVEVFAHPQFMAAIERLRDLGLSNKDAVFYVDSVSKVEAYTHPQFMAAIARLRGLGLSNEGAVWRTRSVSDVNVFMHPQFVAAIERLRDLGLSNKDAVWRTGSVSDVNVYMHPQFAQAAENLINGGRPIDQVLHQLSNTANRQRYSNLDRALRSARTIEEEREILELLSRFRQLSPPTLELVSESLGEHSTNRHLFGLIRTRGERLTDDVRLLAATILERHRASITEPRLQAIIQRRVAAAQAALPAEVAPVSVGTGAYRAASDLRPPTSETSMLLRRRLASLSGPAANSVTPAAPASGNQQAAGAPSAPAEPALAPAQERTGVRIEPEESRSPPSGASGISLADCMVTNLERPVAAARRRGGDD